MADGWLPLVDAPDWLDSVLTDLALAVGLGALVSYTVFVVPDSDPLLGLPAVLTISPVLWVWAVATLLALPLFRWGRVGERTAVWWERHVK